MKTKNLILGLVAFVFAVGTAVASTFFASVDAFISVNPAGSQPAGCYDSGVNCDDANLSNNCLIRVFDDSEGDFVTKQGYKPNTSCTVALTTNGGVQTSSIHIE